MPYRWHSSVKLTAFFSDNRTNSWRKDMRLTTPHGISSPPFRFQGELCLWLLKKCYPCLRYTCYLCLQSIHPTGMGGDGPRDGVEVGESAVVVPKPYLIVADQPLIARKTVELVACFPNRE